MNCASCRAAGTRRWRLTVPGLDAERHLVTLVETRGERHAPIGAALLLARAAGRGRDASRAAARPAASQDGRRARRRPRDRSGAAAPGASRSRCCRTCSTTRNAACRTWRRRLRWLATQMPQRDVRAALYMGDLTEHNARDEWRSFRDQLEPCQNGSCRSCSRPAITITAATAMRTAAARCSTHYFRAAAGRCQAACSRRRSAVRHRKRVLPHRAAARDARCAGARVGAARVDRRMGQPGAVALRTRSGDRRDARLSLRRFDALRLAHARHGASCWNPLSFDDGEGRARCTIGSTTVKCCGTRWCGAIPASSSCCAATSAAGARDCSRVAAMTGTWCSRYWRIFNCSTRAASDICACSKSSRMDVRCA